MKAERVRYSDAVSIERYRKIRKAGRTLVYRVLNACINKDMLRDSAKLLGIPVKGDTVMFDCEEETNVLTDFLLFDYKVNGKNAVQAYGEEHEGLNKVENELLNSWLSSYTSLFEVVTISSPTLRLRDVLNNMNKPIQLIDMGFSATAKPGALLFIRLIPINHCCLTSGMAFAFRNELKQHILREYEKLRKKIKKHDDDLKRYILFFKLSRECGLEVIHIWRSRNAPA
jgi:hypothetical protein